MVNSGFETGDFTGWTNFGNSFVSNMFPRTGTFSARMFGNFSGGFNVSGVFQNVPVTAGLDYTYSGFNGHQSLDPIVGGNVALFRLDWLDATMMQISFTDFGMINSATPTDTFLMQTITQTAPVGAVNASLAILFLQPGFDGGAALFDDISFNQVPEPSTYALLSLLGLGFLLHRRRAKAST